MPERLPSLLAATHQRAAPPNSANPSATISSRRPSLQSPCPLTMWFVITRRPRGKFLHPLAKHTCPGARCSVMAPKPVPPQAIGGRRGPHGACFVNATAFVSVSLTHQDDFPLNPVRSFDAVWCCHHARTLLVWSSACSRAGAISQSCPRRWSEVLHTVSSSCAWLLPKWSVFPGTSVDDCTLSIQRQSIQLVQKTGWLVRTALRRPRPPNDHGTDATSRAPSTSIPSTSMTQPCTLG